MNFPLNLFHNSYADQIAIRELFDETPFLDLLYYPRFSSTVWWVSSVVDFKTGFDAYDKNDFETAFRDFSKAADQEDLVAIYNLTPLYYHGSGVEKELAQTIKRTPEQISKVEVMARLAGKI